METEDVLAEAAIAGVDLPRATLDALTKSGVPRELRLPDWHGPTLFSSELGGGRLVSTAEPGALIGRTGADESYIVGAVRDTLDEAGKPYSAFALRKGSGEVYLLDAADPRDDRFVNANLTAFLASIEAFHTAWPRLVSGTADRDEVVASFRRLLVKLDPRAVEDPHHYWPGWLDELE